MGESRLPPETFKASLPSREADQITGGSSLAAKVPRDRHYIGIRVPLVVQRAWEWAHGKSWSVYMSDESFLRSLEVDPDA